MATGAPKRRQSGTPPGAAVPGSRASASLERRGQRCSTYRGPDRRVAELPTDLGPSRTSFVLAISLCAAGALAAITASGRAAHAAGTELSPRTLDLLVDGAALTLGLAATVVAHERWKIRRDALSIEVGTALAILTAFVVAAPLLQVGTAPVAQLSPVALGGRLGVAAVLVMSIVGAEVRSNARLSTSLLGYGALATAAAGALSVPAVRDLALGGVSGRLAVIIVVVVSWLLLAAVFWWVARSRRSPIRAWIAVALLAFAVADFALFTFTGPWGQTFARAMRVGSFAAGLHALTAELRQVLVALAVVKLEARHVLDRTIDRLVQQSRRHSEIVHDASSSLLAIQGAVTALAHTDVGPVHSRLVHALHGELERLQQLVVSQPEPSRPVPFDLVSLVDSMVVCYQASGHPVTIAVNRPQIAVMGRPGDTGEAIQNLIDNALRHAPGSPVHVVIASIHESAFVSVSDHGPGIAPDELEGAPERGRRGTTVSAPGSGLGLYVARRLVEMQGGHLSIANRPHGGLRCEIELPIKNATTASFDSTLREALWQR